MADRMSGGVVDSSMLPELTRCFEEIDVVISGTSENDVASIMLDPVIQDHRDLVQRLRAYHECVNECRLAESILVTEDPRKMIDDYMALTYPLTAIHTTEFRDSVRDDLSCLLIGCGAVPSTALLLLDHTDMALTCVDRVAESCALGQRILEASGRRSTRFLNADAMDLFDLREWDVIFVSALAGMTWEAQDMNTRDALVEHLIRNSRHDALIIFRSAYALGNLIYPSVRLNQLRGYRAKAIRAPDLGRSSLAIFQREGVGEGMEVVKKS
jgi:predicted O-methyltransferase YrrM